MSPSLPRTGTILTLMVLLVASTANAARVSAGSVKTESGYVQALKRAGEARRHLAAGDSVAWLSVVQDMAAVRGVVLAEGDTVATDLLWIASATLRGFEEDNSDVDAAIRLHGESDVLVRRMLRDVQAQAAFELEDLRQAGLFRPADPPQPELFSVFDRLRGWLDRQLSRREGVDDDPTEEASPLPEIVRHARTALFIVLLLYVLWPIVKSIRVMRRGKARRATQAATTADAGDLYDLATTAEKEGRWTEAARLYTAWLLGKLTSGGEGVVASSAATLRERAAAIADPETRRAVSDLLLGYEFFVYGGRTPGEGDIARVRESALSIAESLPESPR